MRKRILGRTGLEVSELSIGGLYTSSLAGGVAETRRMLCRAAELGINVIDTAPAYADSERVLGEALNGIGADFLIMTKLGGRPQPFDPQDKTALQKSIDESRRLLHRDVIDILLIHEPDRPQQYNWWTNYNPLQGPVLDLIEDLKSKGVIRFSGLAGTTVNEMTSLVASDRFDVLLTAFNYNVLFREAEEELLPAAVRRNMGVVAGSTMGQGFLARRFDQEVRNRPCWLAPARQQQFLSFYRLLDEVGMTPYEICLRFVLANAAVSTVPIGCKTTEQLEQSTAAAAKGPLPEDILTRLDEIARIVPYRPFEEPMILPFGKQYFGPGIANMGAAVPVGRTPLCDGEDVRTSTSRRNLMAR